MWALSYYLTQLSSGCHAVVSRIPDSQRPDVVGKATPDRGGPRKSPDGVDPKTSGWASKRTRKTQRDGHNSGVKIWSLCSVSSTLSHANLTNKVRGKILLKKSSCVFLPASFLHASFIPALSFMRLSFCVRPSLLLLSRFDTAHDYITIIPISRYIYIYITRVKTLTEILKH